MTYYLLFATVFAIVASQTHGFVAFICGVLTVFSLVEVVRFIGDLFTPRQNGLERENFNGTD